MFAFVPSDVSKGPFMPLRFTCRDCGSSVAFYSRRRNFREKYLLPLLLLRPFRCADCFQRCYRSVFLTARQPRERRDAVSASGPRSHVQHIA
jgi:hypothetical protein